MNSYRYALSGGSYQQNYMPAYVVAWFMAALVSLVTGFADVPAPMAMLARVVFVPALVTALAALIREAYR